MSAAEQITTWGKTEKVEDVLKVGDEVDVKLLEIDEKTGKMRLSMRALQPKPEGYIEPVRRPRPEGGRGGFGGHDRHERITEPLKFRLCFL